MAVIKRILAAIDFSKYSPATLEYAATLASALDAEVVMVNVINQRDIDTVRTVANFTGQLRLEDYIQRQKEDRLTQMNRLLQDASANGLRVVREVRVGLPVLELLDAIRETGADLVVMGAKGRTDLAATLFGSTADKVFRRSPVPVMSIRGSEHDDRLTRLTP